jgi:hypothetical protein
VRRLCMAFTPIRPSYHLKLLKPHHAGAKYISNHSNADWIDSVTAFMMTQISF